MAPGNLSQPAGLDDEAGDRVGAVSLAQGGEHVGPRAPHAPGIRLHHPEIGTDHGGEVGLVDDEEIGPGDAGAALAWDLLAASDIDDVEGEVGEFRREGRREVVAAGFDQDQVELREVVGASRPPPRG